MSTNKNIDQEFKPGAICRLREPKQGERLEGAGKFPITLAWKGAVGLPDAWWADDADGRRLWFMESDLVVIGASRRAVED
jgi:hypothetical protein